MPRIGIDCRFASGLSGLGTYTRELVSALTARRDPWTYVLFVSSLEEAWHQHLSCEKIVVPYRHYTLAEQLFLPALYRKSGISLMFVPHFNIPYLCRIPTVCTIHDLILHHYPNQASGLKRLIYRLIFSHAVTSAKHVFTISDYTKQDLMMTYPSIPADCITVAYPGISPLFSPADEAAIQRIRSTFSLTKPYFLYVGNAKEHKNVSVLLEAFVLLNQPDAELILLSTGKEVHTLALPANVRVLRKIKNEDLPAIYSGAIACVTASLYEGFGLPVIEAMACGCPVIASSRTSIPEVSCNKATLIEPTAQAFAQAMQRQLAITPDRSALSQGWHERYNWEKTAQKSADVFARVIESYSS